MRFALAVVCVLLIGTAAADTPIAARPQLSPIPPVAQWIDGTPLPARAEGDTCIAGNATGTPTYYLSGGLTAGRGMAVIDSMEALDACCGTPGVLPLSVWWAVVWAGGSGPISFIAHGAIWGSQPGSGAPPDTCFARPAEQICNGNGVRWTLSDPGSGYWYTWVDFPLENCTYLPRTGYYFNAVLIDSSGANIYRLVDNVLRNCYDWGTTDGGTSWGELYSSSGTAWSLLLYSQFRCTQQVPIEMSSLSAVAVPGQVQVRWRTESEMENLGFNVYRGAGIERSKINEWMIPGAGTTLSPNDYEFVDLDVAVGTRFQYWVSDVSFGGVETFHGPVVVVVPQERPSELGLTVDGSRDVLTLNMAIPSEGQTKLSIYNVAGHEVGVLVNQVLPAGRGQIEWDGTTASGKAAPGAYIVRLVHDSGVVSAKAVLR